MADAVGRYDQIDPAVEARVDDLLGRMTLAEKVGQLVQIDPFLPFDPETLMEQARQAEAAGEPFVFQPEVRPDLEAVIGAGGIGSIFGTADVRLINRCQRAAVTGSRLGIPLIFGNDVIHGLRTVFPIPLAEAATWDPALLEQAARVAAEEASATGTDWIFAPMIDVARDPRWGRIAEGAGEDPFLGSAMARARVRGFQAADLASGRRVVACPKHYVGLWRGGGGPRLQHRRHLRADPARCVPAAVQGCLRRRGGHGDEFVQRDRRGARDLQRLHPAHGACATNGAGRAWWSATTEAVRELIAHGVAADLKEAARLSILAGLDMDMVSNAYADHLAALVEEGAVPLARVDEAVRRVLRLKFRLGLFEQPVYRRGAGRPDHPARRFPRPGACRWPRNRWCCSRTRAGCCR